jgi:hypothetical protein
MIGQPWSNFRYALDAASTWRRFFTSQDLSRFTGQSINDEALRNVVRRDSRFIWLESGHANEKIFVAKNTLFRWFIALNFRLAGDPKPLTTGELTRSMSLHCRGVQWESLPPKVERFGRRLGLCLAARTTGRYVFPLAQILWSIGAKKTTVTILEALANDRSRSHALHEPLAAWVDEALSLLTRREAHIVRERVGLGGQAPKSLGQIGDAWNITRERVRQIELKARGRLDHPRCKRSLICALVCDVIRRRGSLVVRTDSPDEPLRTFITECVGVPRAEFPKLRVAVLGWSSKTLPDPSSLVRFPESLDTDAVADRLEADWNPSLPDEDLTIVADSIATLARKQLTPGKRVYMALREIGKPAHFSVIAEIHNSLFPDKYSRENAVHGILSREPYGIVWIGVRGTYALREWGFERPSAPLFDQVAEIVADSYEATGKPVPFATIAAEMGKRRSIVHPTSLNLAAHANPRVQRVSEDHFVPRNAGEEEGNDIDLDQLDRILAAFERGDS